MATLPPEILLLICKQLGRQNIAAFSLVNKRCSGAAEDQRFRGLRLEIRGPEKLRRDLER